jgi:hypothetical protein
VTDALFELVPLSGSGATASHARPACRYTAGSMAGRASTRHGIAPAGVFDKQIRKLNRLAG